MMCPHCGKETSVAAHRREGNIAEYSFALPVPPSANRYWQVYNNRIVVTQEAKDYKDVVYRQLQRYKPLFGDTAVNFTVFRPARRGDLDNYTKVMFDALNGLVWQDDKQVVEIHSFRAYDKLNPRVEFLVYETEAHNGTV